MPLQVLNTIQRDLVDYAGRGLSVMEMSHRSTDFMEIAQSAEQDLRQLLSIPDNYHVLFMQGGANAQFALTVQNLDAHGQVDFANTGFWSAKAQASASLLTTTREAVSCISDPLIAIPAMDQWNINPQASYLHLTDNETIDGVAFDSLPDTQLPLVADMSSSILSGPIDVARYGLIYAGAQKNIGPAGITVVIVRDDLLERSATNKSLPPVFSYASMAAAGSMLNTPPTFAWYAAGLVFQWLLDEGGLEVIRKRNQQQAARVYQLIDQYDCYTNNVHKINRSIMNIPFQLIGRATEQFLSGANERDLTGLKGHKSVGGLRVSLYNAVTDSAVDSLVEYLIEFAEN